MFAITVRVCDASALGTVLIFLKQKCRFRQGICLFTVSPF